MTDIYATVAVPSAQYDTARAIGGQDNWTLARQLTTDAAGAPPATHFASSGDGDAALLALIVQLPGVLVNYTDAGADAVAGFGLHFVVEEI